VRSMHSDSFVRSRRHLYVCMHARSLGHVDDLAFAGKDVRPQAKVIVLVALEVQQNVVVASMYASCAKRELCG